MFSFISRVIKLDVIFYKLDKKLKLIKIFLQNTIEEDLGKNLLIFTKANYSIYIIYFYFFKDWWCKFYASIGDKSKSGPYLEKGYERLVVSNLIIKFNPNFKIFFCFFLQKGLQ